MTGMFMYKHNKNLLPNIFNNFFIINVGNTRQDQMYRLPWCRTQKKKNSITYKGPYFWNNTIMLTRNKFETDRTSYAFQRSLKKLLFRKP